MNPKRLNWKSFEFPKFVKVRSFHRFKSLITKKQHDMVEVVLVMPGSYWDKIHKMFHVNKKGKGE